MVETDPDSDGGHRTGELEDEPIVTSNVADGGVPTLDAFLHVLRNQRRRCVLHCLFADDLRDVSTLARRVAARLDQTTPDDVADDRYEQVRVALVHVDIPMLAETGIVSYDRRSGDLCLDSPPAPIERLLESCATLETHTDSTEGSEGDTSAER